MLECGVCGGTIVQTWNGRKPAYRCWYNHSRGSAVCANSLVVEMHLADDTVLQAVTRDVLDPEVVPEALDLALLDLEQPAPAVAARLDTLKNELARLEVELNRYAEAVADAGPLETLLQAVKVREQRRDTIRSELKTLTTQRRVESRDTSDVRATLVKYLDTWRAMAHQGVAEARGLLRAVLVGRFVFTPVIPPPDLPPRKGPGRKPRFIYELKGEASLSGLIAGLISASSVVAPTGFEPVFESRSRFRQVSYVVTDQQQPATSTRLKHAPESSLKHPEHDHVKREPGEPSPDERKLQNNFRTGAVEAAERGSGIDPRGPPNGQACAGLLPDGSPAPPARRAQQRIRVAARLLGWLSR